MLTALGSGPALPGPAVCGQPTVSVSLPQTQRGWPNTHSRGSLGGSRAEHTRARTHRHTRAHAVVWTSGGLSWRCYQRAALAVRTVISCMPASLCLPRQLIKSVAVLFGCLAGRMIRLPRRHSPNPERFDRQYGICGPVLCGGQAHALGDYHTRSIRANALPPTHTHTPPNNKRNPKGSKRAHTSTLSWLSRQEARCSSLR